MTKKAVILLSGGLDSATCLAIAKSEGYACHALSISYGQRNSSELEAAKRVAKHQGVISHKTLNVPIGELGGSALTDKDIDVPDYSNSTEIPITYVPARNTIFLSMALGWAETLDANDIFIGANAIDYSGYPDCRPVFINAFQNLANLATKKAVEGQPIQIRTPLIQLTKAEIIDRGNKLGVDYSMTISCYSADEKGRACGRCESCVFRKNGFIDAGFDDPTIYR